MSVARSRVLVGREPELGVLRAVRDRASGGRPALVVVEGEAGIGKTRLVHELADEVEASDPDGVIATGHGVNLAAGAIPYGLAGALLQDLVLEIGEDTVARLLGRQAAALDPLLHGWADTDGDGVLDRLALFGAVQRLLGLLSRDRLVSLFLEDLHWADASSLDLLLFLAKAARPGRLLLVATVRPVSGLEAGVAAQVAELVRAASVPVVRLGPLTDAQVSEQAQDALGDTLLDDRLRRDLERLSDGVPLYVEELLAAAMADHRSPLDTVPSTLLVTLTARVADLDAGSLLTLQAASVTERPFRAQELAAVRERAVGQVHDDLALGVTVGVLDDLGAGRFRFHHALQRKALADALSPSLRSDLHARWAAVLSAGGGGLAEIANHWFLAGDADRAIASALAAARQAWLADAPHEAAEHLRHALDLWPSASEPEGAAGVDRDTVLVRLFDELEACEDYDAVLRLADQERQERQDAPPATALWLDLEISRARWEKGQPLEVWIPDVDDVVSMVAELPPDEVLFRELRLLCDEVDLRHGDCTPVLELIGRTGAAIGITAVDAIVDQIRADLAVGNDDFATARELGMRAMRAAEHRPRDFATAVRTTLVAEWALGHLRDAVTLGEQMLARLGSPLVEPSVWNQTATVVAEAHRLLGAYDLAEAAYASIDQLPVTITTGATASMRAVTAAVRGRFDLGEEQLRRAAGIVPDVGSAGYPVNWTGQRVWARAALDAEQGRTAEALDRLLPVLAAPDLAAVPAFNWQYVHAAAQYLARGSTAEAELVDSAAARIAAVGDVGVAWRAEVDAHLARARGAAARDQWSTAADGWRSLEVPWHEAVCRWHLAACVLDGGGSRSEREQAAREALMRARQLASDIGAVPLLGRIDELAHHGRLGISGAGGSAPAASPLTDRETEVLALVAAGRTNEQIGKVLYMSPKTASVHVSRILAKLGAANRTELATLAHRLGLLEADGRESPGSG